MSAFPASFAAYRARQNRRMRLWLAIEGDDMAWAMLLSRADALPGPGIVRIGRLVFVLR